MRVVDGCDISPHRMRMLPLQMQMRMQDSIALQDPMPA